MRGFQEKKLILLNGLMENLDGKKLTLLNSICRNKFYKKIVLCDHHNVYPLNLNNLTEFQHKDHHKKITKSKK